MNNIARILVLALALWLTTLIVGGTGQNGLWIETLEDNLAGTAFSFVIVAIIFGVINTTVGRLVRVLAFPIRILTLGLFSLVINALLLMLVGWISNILGFGLKVDSFGWAFLGGIVLSIINLILNAFFKTKK